MGNANIVIGAGLIQLGAALFVLGIILLILSGVFYLIGWSSHVNSLLIIALIQILAGVGIFISGFGVMRSP